MVSKRQSTMVYEDKRSGGESDHFGEYSTSLSRKCMQTGTRLSIIIESILGVNWSSRSGVWGHDAG